jgi:hypothetical protein
MRIWTAADELWRTALSSEESARLERYVQYSCKNRVQELRELRERLNDAMEQLENHLEVFDG